MRENQKKTNSVSFTGITVLIGALGVLLAIVSTGCGSKKYSSELADDVFVPSSASGSGGGSGSGNNNTGIPPMQTLVYLTGYDDEQTIVVPTRNILRVKFRPEQATEFVGGTGYTPVYSQLAVKIGVENYEEFTPLLYNGLGSTQQTSAAIDFSSVFTPTCPVGSTTCVEQVTIRIKQPNYDYWCYNFPYHTNCTSTPGYSTVYSTHTVVGTIFIQTDFTGSI